MKCYATALPETSIDKRRNTPIYKSKRSNPNLR